MMVVIGSKVTFRLNGSIKTCVIVNPGKGDPTQNRVSGDTPLAKLMLGRQKDDVVRGQVPAGEVIIEILRVENDDSMTVLRL